jgi:hypothetical protein
MNRRHFAAVAASVAVALSVTTVAAAGAFAPSASADNAAHAVARHPQRHAHAAPEHRHHKKSLAEREAARAARANLARFYAAVSAQAQAQAAADQAKLDKALVAHEAVQNSMFSCIRDAESGDNYGLTSGAYGILISTWDAYASIWSPYGSFSVPGAAPAAVQDLVAYELYEIGGGYGGWHDYCTEG